MLTVLMLLVCCHLLANVEFIWFRWLTGFTSCFGICYHLQQRFCVFNIFAVSILFPITHTHTHWKLFLILINVLLAILLFHQGHLLGSSSYWADETEPEQVWMRDRCRTWCFIQKFASLSIAAFLFQMFPLSAPDSPCFRPFFCPFLSCTAT